MAKFDVAPFTGPTQHVRVSPKTTREHYRGLALDALKGRRPFPSGSHEADWRTQTAWTYLQMAMGKPSNDWTITPPRVTTGGAA